MLRPYLEWTRLTVRTDHEELRWILTIADDTDKPAHWSLRFSEFAFGIVHRTWVRYQAADALSRRKTIEVDTSQLQDKILVLTVSSSSDKESALHDDLENEFIEEAQYPFTLFLAEALVLAEKGDNHKVDTQTLQELIFEQSKDADCRVALSSVVEPSSTSNSDANGVLVRFAPLHCTLQGYVSSTLHASVRILCHYSLLPSHAGERRMYNSIR